MGTSPLFWGSAIPRVHYSATFSGSGPLFRRFTVRRLGLELKLALVGLGLRLRLVGLVVGLVGLGLGLELVDPWNSEHLEQQTQI